MMKRNSISLNLNTLILQMVGLCLLLLSLTNLTYANTSNTLESVNYKTLPGNRVQIALKLSGPAEKPGGFSIDNPARIALDLANTKSNLASKVTSIGLGNVRSLIAVNAGNRTRAIINLTMPK